MLAHLNQKWSGNTGGGCTKGRQLCKQSPRSSSFTALRDLPFAQLFTVKLGGFTVEFFSLKHRVVTDFGNNV